MTVTTKPQRLDTRPPGLFRLAVISGMTLSILTTPVTALMQWNDGRDQVHLDLTAGVTWDSNIYSVADGDGDLITTFSAGLDYQRRAGLIGIDAGLILANGTFSDNSSENYLNPNLTVDLTKESGRTTGSINLSSARENRADTAANIRTESWNHSAALQWKYPVIERYSLSGRFDYMQRDFIENTALVDLESYAAGLDLFYVYNSARDLVAGYLVRVSESSSGYQFTDHSFTGGITGRIFPKVSGSMRFGYQLRQDRTGGPDYRSWTSLITATWTVNSRLSVTGMLAKEFSLTATDINVDTVTGGLEAQMAFSPRTTLFAGINFASSKFLGTAGGGRDDFNAGTNLGASYSFGPRLRASLTYSYSQNWSTLQLSDFEQQSVSLVLSSRL